MAYDKKIRNSNLEILRIISMLLIIAHHFAGHGFKIEKLPYTFNHYLLHIFESGGKLGVICFVFISGYFMCNLKFDFKRLLILYGQVVFYTVIIALMFFTVLTPTEPISKKYFIKMLFPIGYREYWFITDYVVMVSVSPLLNKILQLGKEVNKRIIFFAFLFWSVIPCFTLAQYGYEELIWFLSLYMISGYIKLYFKPQNGKAFKNFIIAVISFCIAISIRIACCILNRVGISFFYNFGYIFLGINSPFILISAIELFIGILKLKPCSNKVINTISSAAFGVYLIHDNNIVRPYLWKKLLKVENLFNSKFFVIYAVIDILAVYIVCSLIDLLRQVTVEKIFIKVVYNNTEKIKNTILKLLQKPIKKIKSLIVLFY